MRKHKRGREAPVPTSDLTKMAEAEAAGYRANGTEPPPNPFEIVTSAPTDPAPAADPQYLLKYVPVRPAETIDCNGKPCIQFIVGENGVDSIEYQEKTGSVLIEGRGNQLMITAHGYIARKRL